MLGALMVYATQAQTNPAAPGGARRGGFGRGFGRGLSAPGGPPAPVPPKVAIPRPTTEEVEKILPRNTCSLIKSAFGFKLGKVCPYIESADMIVGENTCDGKKKSYEVLKDLVPNLHVMDLPQAKSSQGRELLKAEYYRFKDAMEELTGVTIDVQRLKKGIEIVNNKRKAVYRLSTLRVANPVPISGLDALLINQVYFYDDPARFTDSVNKICDELGKRIEKGL